MTKFPTVVGGPLVGSVEGKMALAIQYDRRPLRRGSPDLGCIKRVFLCGS